jgi:arylsulfatase A
VSATASGSGDGALLPRFSALLLACLGLAQPALASWQPLHRWTFEPPAPYNDSVGAAHLTPSASGVSLIASGDAALGQAARLLNSANLTAPQAALASIGTNAFRLRLVVKREAVGAAVGLLDNLNGTDTGFQLFFQANNTLRLRLDDTAGNTALYDSTNTIAADGLWHEVVVTVDRALPAGLAFKVDGIAEPPLDPSGVPGILAPSQNLFVGNLNGTSPLLGALAEVEILADLPPPPPTVAFAPTGSFSRTPLTLSLTASESAATIRYTLDGSEPDTNSPAYIASLLLTRTSQVRARAWHEGVAGPVSGETYVIATNAPSVVLFVAEDVGVGDLHCYGSPVHRTPHLDQLCREGLRFTQSYAAGASNAPNQYALLTARLLPRSGLLPFIAPGSTTGLASREWTLGEAFLKAGWRTAFIGGWHLGDASSSLPHRQGFQTFYGLALPREGEPLANLRENDTILTNTPAPEALLDAFVTRALAFLDAQGTNRFLLVLQVPPLPASGASLGGSYGNRIEALDDAVGQLTARLAALGQRENTLFVFSSDEGPALTTTFPRGATGLFRDGRGTVFEGGVRIPAIACWPGVILPGPVSQAVWWLPDLPPTLCSVAGLPWPADRPMDGTNRVAALTGLRLRPDGSERLFLHRQTGAAPSLIATRTGIWKYHRNLIKSDPENTHISVPLLFELERDPAERVNASATQAALRAQLEAAAIAHLASFTPPFPQLPATDTLSASLEVITSPGSEPPLRLRFLRPGDTLDDYYAVEHSTNLHAWVAWPLTALPYQVTSAPQDTEQVTLTPPSFPWANPSFYRLRALLP